MRSSILKAGVAALLAAPVSLGTSLPAGSEGGGRPFSLTLSGAEEFNAAGAPINPHGDADSGTAVLTLNQGQEEVCWSFGELAFAEDEALPHVAHIHRAEPGFAGPVVVDIFGGAAPAPAPTAYPTGTTCVPAAAEVIKAIRKDPGSYYLNLHNAQHPGGVMRAQLG